MAYSRKGDVTIYEWAIQVFDRYDDKPTKLSPERRSGSTSPLRTGTFPRPRKRDWPCPDLSGAPWIYWGPQWHGQKTYDAGSIGTMILGK